MTKTKSQRRFLKIARYSEKHVKLATLAWPIKLKQAIFLINATNSISFFPRRLRKDRYYWSVTEQLPLQCLSESPNLAKDSWGIRLTKGVGGLRRGQNSSGWKGQWCAVRGGILQRKKKAKWKKKSNGCIYVWFVPYIYCPFKVTSFGWFLLKMQNSDIYHSTTQARPVVRKKVQMPSFTWQSSVSSQEGGVKRHLEPHRPTLVGPIYRLFKMFSKFFVVFSTTWPARSSRC